MNDHTKIQIRTFEKLFWIASTCSRVRNLKDLESSSSSISSPMPIQLF